MKKIALFGASGKTGQLFLQQALAKGYPVKALVRTPAKVTQKAPQLEVLAGDVLNETDVNKTVAGTDVVVSLFGHVKGSPPWLQTEGTINIINAMKKQGVPRIVSLSGGGLPYPEQDKPKLPDKLIRTIMKIAVPQLLKDAEKHASVLKSSGLKWVIARAPRLLDSPKKGTYRIGWVGVNASTKIARADFADFILRLVDDEQFDFQMPFVSE
jgi:putative NADH-flavin reductase